MMFIYLFPTLIFLLLISRNIILLNEESLILLCFSMFCWLFYNNFSNSLSIELDDRSLFIRSELKNSLNKLSTSIQQILDIKDKYWNLFYNFKMLGSNCLRLTETAIDWLVIYSKSNIKLPFPKKLIFLYRLENQTERLVILLLVHKLKKVTDLKHFYSNVLPISHFKCVNKVVMLEHIQEIKKAV